MAKALTKTTAKDLAEEVRKQHGGRIPKMTLARKKTLEANVIAKLADKVNLTTGTKAERVAKLTRDIQVATDSKNPVIIKLRAAMVAELATLTPNKK